MKRGELYRVYKATTQDPKKYRDDKIVELNEALKIALELLD